MIEKIIIIIILIVNTSISNAPEPTPRPVPTVADARAYALKQLGRTQFACIDAIFERESRWRVNALNRKSGAYGIPQALPGNKMRTAGKDWKTNPVTQVKWGIKYIRARYGTPCNALEHIRIKGWY